MKTYKIFYLILLITVFLIGCKSPTEEPDNKTTVEVEYQESTENFVNPERGFYTFQEFRSNDNNQLSVNFLNNLRENGMSLVYTAYTMPDYRDKPIPQAYLDRIKANMQTLREGGCKSVLRFRYTTSESDKPWDAPQDVLLGHIAQIKPILQEYSDVIAVLEAGFIGVWGEWYYTDNYIFRPAEDQYEPRKIVLQALLDALPKDRMVLTRYPAAKIHTFGISHTDTITSSEAYNQSDRARVGFHNDCFLADQDDRGTFGGNRNFRRFWEAESKYLPMGGETCALSSYSECENAIIQMEKYHWSFLNLSYHPSVLGSWRTNNCFEDIQRRLGYRFVLQKGEFSRKTEAGSQFDIKLTLKNVGFAAPYNPRYAELVLVNKNNSEDRKFIQLNVDPRYWFAAGEYEIKTNIALTENMKGNEYNIYLHLPDMKANLKGNPAYSIRLANNGVWEAETGFNKLHTITVK